MKPLIRYWVDFCSEQALRPAYYMSGVQKIIQGAVWVVPRDILFDKTTDITDFGYSAKGNKMRSLKKHYFNKEKTKYARKLVKTKWEQRSYGSCGFPLTGDQKKWTKQDFCMQSCTVTHYPAGGLKICIFYRTTEVIKKFGADLIFIRRVILPRFDRIKSIDDVTFMISNLTVHPMFFTTLLAHHYEPIDFLEKIRHKDPRYFNGICKWMGKYLFEGETSWIQKFSQAKQTHLAMKRLMSDDRLEELRSYFKNI